MACISHASLPVRNRVVAVTVDRLISHVFEDRYRLYIGVLHPILSQLIG